MISRRTARVVARAYQFEYLDVEKRYASATRKHYTWSTLRLNSLHDFLYDHDYPAWLLNQAKGMQYKRSEGHEPHASRVIQEWIMRLHTGETARSATPNWSWDQRRELGQRYLEELAEDMIAIDPTTERASELKRSLELDGYQFKDGVLLRPESNVLDVQEEQGVIKSLFAGLELANAETAFHHLALSETHYLAGRWDDSISNSRKFFESVLQEVAASHSRIANGKDLKEGTYSRPGAVRDYLEREGLLEAKEKEAITKVYGLLSHTGGHPYMAQDDQARLLRHLALTLSQFVLLRFQGSQSRRPAASA